MQNQIRVKKLVKGGKVVKKKEDKEIVEMYAGQGKKNYDLTQPMSEENKYF